MEFANKLLGWVAMGTIAFSVYALFLHKRNRAAFLERFDWKTGKIIRTEKEGKKIAEKERLKSEVPSPNFPFKMQTYLAMIMIITYLSVHFRVMSYNWYTVNPTFAVICIAHFAVLSFNLGRVFVDRIKSIRTSRQIDKAKREFKHENYGPAQGGVPDDKRTAILIPFMDDLKPDFAQKLKKLFMYCRDRGNGNIVLIVMNTSKRTETEMGNDRDAIDQLKSELDLTENEEIFYAVRGETRRLINRDKKLGALSEITRLLGDGVLRPEAIDEAHVGFLLRREAFKAAGNVGIVTTVLGLLIGLLFRGGIETASIGIGVGLMIAMIFAIVNLYRTSGKKGDLTLEAQGKDLTKDFLIDEFYGDMRKLGFKESDYSKMKEEEATEFVTRENRRPGEHLPLWAFFLLDDKCSAGMPHARTNLGEEEDPLFDPVRKAIEVMAVHPEVAFGTPYIYILGKDEETLGVPEEFLPEKEKITQYSGLLSDAQKQCAPFENSMLINVGQPSFYGKGLVKLKPWLKGIKAKGEWVPGLFHTGLIFGALSAVGISFIIHGGLAYAGIYAFAGMILGMLMLGGKEGRYYFGAFAAGFFGELSHDYFECAYAGVIHLKRAMIFEPASPNTLAQQIRTFRWSKGVFIMYLYHMFGPGVKIAQRFLIFVCTLMYTITPIFLSWHTLMLVAQTFSGAADTVANVPRLLEYDSPVISFALFVWMLIAIMVSPMLSGKKESEHYGGISVAEKLKILHFANGVFPAYMFSDTVQMFKAIFEISVWGLPDRPKRDRDNMAMVGAAITAVLFGGITAATYLSGYPTISVIIFGFIALNGLKRFIEQAFRKFIPMGYIIAGLMLISYALSPLWAPALALNITTHFGAPAWLAFAVVTPLIIYMLRKTEYLWNILRDPKPWNTFSSGSTTVRPTLFDEVQRRSIPFIYGLASIFVAAIFWSNFWPFVWGTALYYSWFLGFFYTWITGKPAYLFKTSSDGPAFPLKKIVRNIIRDDVEMFTGVPEGEDHVERDGKSLLSFVRKIIVDLFKPASMIKNVQTGTSIEKPWDYKADIAFMIGSVFIGIPIAVLAGMTSIWYSIGVIGGIGIFVGLFDILSGIAKVGLRDFRRKAVILLASGTIFLAVGIVFSAPGVRELTYVFHGGGMWQDFSAVSMSFAIPGIIGYAFAFIPAMMAWIGGIGNDIKRRLIRPRNKRKILSYLGPSIKLVEEADKDGFKYFMGDFMDNVDFTAYDMKIFEKMSEISRMSQTEKDALLKLLYLFSKIHENIVKVKIIQIKRAKDDKGLSIDLSGVMGKIKLGDIREKFNEKDIDISKVNESFNVPFIDKGFILTIDTKALLKRRRPESPAERISIKRITVNLLAMMLSVFGLSLIVSCEPFSESGDTGDSLFIRPSAGLTTDDINLPRTGFAAFTDTTTVTGVSDGTVNAVYSINDGSQGYGGGMLSYDNLSTVGTIESVDFSAIESFNVGVQSDSDVVKLEIQDASKNKGTVYLDEVSGDAMGIYNVSTVSKYMGTVDFSRVAYINFVIEGMGQAGSLSIKTDNTGGYAAPVETSSPDDDIPVIQPTTKNENILMPLSIGQLLFAMLLSMVVPVGIKSLRRDGVISTPYSDLGDMFTDYPNIVVFKKPTDLDTERTTMVANWTMSLERIPGMQINIIVADSNKENIEVKDGKLFIKSGNIYSGGKFIKFDFENPVEAHYVYGFYDLNLSTEERHSLENSGLPMEASTRVRISLEDSKANQVKIAEEIVGMPSKKILAEFSDPGDDFGYEEEIESAIRGIRNAGVNKIYIQPNNATRKQLSGSFDISTDEGISQVVSSIFGITRKYPHTKILVEKYITSIGVSGEYLGLNNDLRAIVTKNIEGSLVVGPIRAYVSKEGVGGIVGMDNVNAMVMKDVEPMPLHKFLLMCRVDGKQLSDEQREMLTSKIKRQSRKMVRTLESNGYESDIMAIDFVISDEIEKDGLPKVYFIECASHFAGGADWDKISVRGSYRRNLLDTACNRALAYKEGRKSYQIGNPIIFGIPAKDKTREERAFIASKMNGWFGEANIKLAFLEGENQEENLKALEQMTKDETINRQHSVGAALLEGVDFNNEKTRELIGLFMDRANAEIFSTLPYGVEDMTREELRTYVETFTPIVPVIGENSIYELEAMQVYGNNATKLGLLYSVQTLQGLKALKETGQKKAVIWTTGVEHKGLPLSVDIKERRKIMGVTKDNDPVRDVLVITDSRVRTESDVRKYLETTGLEGVIRLEDVILKPAAQGISMEDIAQRIGMDSKDMAFAGVEDEFKPSENYMLVQLAKESKYNVGIYRWVFELMVSGDEALDSAAIEKLGPNLYRYIPPIAPKDYEDAFRRYMDYVEEVLTKA